MAALGALGFVRPFARGRKWPLDYRSTYHAIGSRQARRHWSQTGLLGAPARAAQPATPLPLGLLLDISGPSVLITKPSHMAEPAQPYRFWRCS
jgi:hypothetical protein